jgi:hypothetical protein
VHRLSESRLAEQARNYRERLVLLSQSARGAA